MHSTLRGGYLSARMTRRTHSKSILIVAGSPTGRGTGSGWGYQSRPIGIRATQLTGILTRGYGGLILCSIKRTGGGQFGGGFSGAGPGLMSRWYTATYHVSVAGVEFRLYETAIWTLTPVVGPRYSSR